MSLDNLPEYTNLLNIASEKLGARTLKCSDDFFAEMENLIKPGRGVFLEGKYTDRGKWMDGWESRRKRTEGHDWCIISLGACGVISGVDVDTNHFLGNHPPHCSIEGTYCESDNLENAEWMEILHKSPLEPGSQNFFKTNNDNLFSHVRLNIYPDGGVARLKVYGEVKKDWKNFDETEEVDLASAILGAKSILCNDMFFSHMDNLLMPGKGENMGDGWETKRNRTPGNKDWVIIRLAHLGLISRIIIDTAHFKGNFPDSALIEGANMENDNMENAKWNLILPKSKLQADSEHEFVTEIQGHKPFTHIRLCIFPDGGISRLRIYGHIC